MIRSHWRLGVCALGLAAVAVSPVFSAPDDPLGGDWKLEGSDGIGHYVGTAHVEEGPGNSVNAQLTYKYDGGKDGGASFVGKRAGKWITGKRTRVAGITGVLSNISKKPQNEWFQLSPEGLKLTGTYAGTHEYFSRDALPSPAKATITGDKQIVLVPGAPATIKGSVHLEVTAGKVKLDVKPAGALKLSNTNELGVGTYDVSVEPAKEGSAEVVVLANGTAITSTKLDVVKEKLYLVLFAYMGTEVNYLDGDLNQTKSKVVSKLPGYTVIEDGKSYSQSSIDQKLNDPKSGAKKVVVDWCTTTDDFNKYFDRGSIAGYTWSSHGFMEPFPGCPDSELKIFESRQWTAADMHPEQTGDKHFIREWKTKFDKNGQMDFALNHACCTGGIGDYANEAWEYCTDSTKTRVQALFGKLPEVSELSFTTHDSLKGKFAFQQNFNGSAYFGMWDVKWSNLQASIKP